MIDILLSTGAVVSVWVIVIVLLMLDLRDLS